jgi:signal transduction histidine kinase
MAFLVALLVLSLVFTAGLAFQAQVAARSHRATAERALRDYASFAALEFGVNSKEAIWNSISWVLYQPADLGLGQPTEFRRSPWLDSLVAAADRGEGAGSDSAFFFFRIDLQSRRITASRGCAVPAVRAWLLDTVPVHALTEYKPTWDFAHITRNVDGRPWLIAYVVRRDTRDVPTTAYGFTTGFAPFTSHVFAEIVKYYPFLPQSLVKHTPNDSMLSVRVTDLDRNELFRSAAQYPPTYSASDTVTKFGGYVATVALRPALAEALVIGGLPRSRLPLLLALVTVSAALVVAALLQLRREYELARLRSDFISSISHELRTPLAQVRMFAETLLLGRVRSDDERHRSLEIIDQEARRLTHLVENILQYSRTERQVTRLSPEPTELASQLREAIEGFAPIAQARRVQVATDLRQGIVASVDRGALRQTLINLLDNAVKYGPTGQTVTVGLTFAGGRAFISVEDQGPGIAPRERNRIWEPFYRLERDANSAVAGSGIGLAVVSELVALHAGRAWVESAPGGGARFVVELPATLPECPPESEAAAAESRTTEGATR